MSCWLQCLRVFQRLFLFKTYRLPLHSLLLLWEKNDRVHVEMCAMLSQDCGWGKNKSSFIWPFLKEEIKGLNKNLLESIPLQQNHIPDRCVTSCYSSPFCFTPFISLTGAELHGMRRLFSDVNICILKTLPSFEECNGYPHRDIRETFEVSALLPAFVFWACNMNE